LNEWNKGYQSALREVFEPSGSKQPSASGRIQKQLQEIWTPLTPLPVKWERGNETRETEENPRKRTKQKREKKDVTEAKKNKVAKQRERER
jgi:hypothetical protein